MFKKFGKGLKEMSPTRGIVFLLGLGMILWGSVVANPLINTFNVEFYMVLANIAPELTWGVVFIFMGLITLVGVIRRDQFLVRLGTGLGFFLWLLLSCLYFVAEPTITPIATNFILAMLHGWIYLQTKLRPEHLSHNIEVVSVEGKSVRENQGEV